LTSFTPDLHLVTARGGTCLHSALSVTRLYACFTPVLHLIYTHFTPDLRLFYTGSARGGTCLQRNSALSAPRGSTCDAR
jgi:hypothetical protein